MDCERMSGIRSWWSAGSPERMMAVMLSIPVRMKLLVMMDGWSLLLPGGVDGPQAGWALLPCEILWGFLDFQFQDDSDGRERRPLSWCRPGLHYHCREMSLSLSSVDGSDDCYWCSLQGSDADVPFCSIWHLSYDGEMPPWCQDEYSKDVYFHINRASEWLWLATQETPQKGQNVLGFPVRTPICHIVPVSRAYGYMGGVKPNFADNNLWTPRLFWYTISLCTWQL